MNDDITVTDRLSLDEIACEFSNTWTWAGCCAEEVQQGVVAYAWIDRATNCVCERYINTIDLDALIDGEEWEAA